MSIDDTTNCSTTLRVPDGRCIQKLRRNRRNRGTRVPAIRSVMIVWAGLGLGSFILQLRGFAKFVTPHKISESLVASPDAVVETADLLEFCPATVMFFAGARWNASPTHYHRMEDGIFCHFTVPEYNAHGNYIILNRAAIPHEHTPSSCADKSFPFEMNFYHGSIGYYSIYAEGTGTYCTEDNTAYIQVDGVGTYDINGEDLAKDKGDLRYRMSYWYIVTGTAFIVVRGFTLRRSFVSCRRFAERCDHMSERVRIQEAAVYVQESMRLSAHGAKNFHRVLLLFLLVDQGVMSDFFLLSTQEGWFGRIQSISLGYNLSGVVSMLFEMVETMNWMNEKLRILAKRLLFNYETVLVGELISAGVLQHYITSLSRSRLQDTESVANVVSHYVMGLLGHIVLALGCLCIIICTRVLGAIGYALWHFGTLRVLAKTCCVDAALGARSKLVLLAGYAWENEELYYRSSTLKALGIFKSVDPDGNELLVHTTLYWISIPQDNLVVLGNVSNQSVIPSSERPCSGVVSFFEDALGGSAMDDVSTADDVVLPLSSRSRCCPLKRSNERISRASEVAPGPAQAKINVRFLKDEHNTRKVLPTLEEANRGPPGRIQNWDYP